MASVNIVYKVTRGLQMSYKDTFSQIKELLSTKRLTADDIAHRLNMSITVVETIMAAMAAKNPHYRKTI